MTFTNSITSTTNLSHIGLNLLLSPISLTILLIPGIILTSVKLKLKLESIQQSYWKYLSWITLAQLLVIGRNLIFGLGQPFNVSSSTVIFNTWFWVAYVLESFYFILVLIGFRWFFSPSTFGIKSKLTSSTLIQWGAIISVALITLIELMILFNPSAFIQSNSNYFIIYRIFQSVKLLILAIFKLIDTIYTNHIAKFHNIRHFEEGNQLLSQGNQLTEYRVFQNIQKLTWFLSATLLVPAIFPALHLLQFATTDYLEFLVMISFGFGSLITLIWCIFDATIQGWVNEILVKFQV